MAISLRRALIASRNFVHTLRASSIRSDHHFSSIISSHPNSSHHFDAHTFSNSPSTNFHQFDTRRSFAKGRKQQIKEEEESEEEGEKEESDGEDDDGRLDQGNVGVSTKVAAASQMDAAVDALSRELAKLRTGRASEDLERVGESHNFLPLGSKSSVRRPTADYTDTIAIIKVVAKSSEDVKQSIRRSRQKVLLRAPRSFLGKFMTSKMAAD